MFSHHCEETGKKVVGRRAGRVRAVLVSPPPWFESRQQGQDPVRFPRRRGSRRDNAMASELGGWKLKTETWAVGGAEPGFYALVHGKGVKYWGGLRLWVCLIEVFREERVKIYGWGLCSETKEMSNVGMGLKCGDEDKGVVGDQGEAGGCQWGRWRRSCAGWMSPYGPLGLRWEVFDDRFGFAFHFVLFLVCTELGAECVKRLSGKQW